jgi:radical SAM protein with 4Fe4S-binding SPASM domain
MKPLRNLNFALSNRCNAKCVWCPVSRGTKLNFDMDTNLVFKIIDEVSDPEFPYEIKNIHMSENGEALYHKDFVEILRYIKKKLPNTEVDMLSNFGLMSNKIAKILIDERLFYSIQVNIDGHDEDSYRAVKGIPLKSVMKNVKHFLELRQDHYPEMKFGINVMTAFEYAFVVHGVFGKNPMQVPKGSAVPVSTYDMVYDMLVDELGQDLVDTLGMIRHSQAGLWAERAKFKSGEFELEDQNLKCPLIKRVQEEMFIAPNGDYYACCLDDNNDMVLGNLKENSVLDIWRSQERINFVNNLKMQNFSKIGYPCNTVGACQTIAINPNEIDSLYQQIKDEKEISFE